MLWSLHTSCMAQMLLSLVSSEYQKFLCSRRRRAICTALILWDPAAQQQRQALTQTPGLLRHHQRQQDPSPRGRESHFQLQALSCIFTESQNVRGWKGNFAGEYGVVGKAQGMHLLQHCLTSSSKGSFSLMCREAHPAEPENARPQINIARPSQLLPC